MGNLIIQIVLIKINITGVEPLFKNYKKKQYYIVLITDSEIVNNLSEMNFFTFHIVIHIIR